MTVLFHVRSTHGEFPALNDVLVSITERVAPTMDSVDAPMAGWVLSATKVIFQTESFLTFIRSTPTSTASWKSLWTSSTIFSIALTNQNVEESLKSLPSLSVISSTPPPFPLPLTLSTTRKELCENPVHSVKQWESSRISWNLWIVHPTRLTEFNHYFYWLHFAVCPEGYHGSHCMEHCQVNHAFFVNALITR